MPVYALFSSGTAPDPKRATAYAAERAAPASVARADARTGETAALAARGSGLAAKYDELDRPPVRTVPSGSY